MGIIITEYNLIALAMLGMISFLGCFFIEVLDRRTGDDQIQNKNNPLGKR